MTVSNASKQPSGEPQRFKIGKIGISIVDLKTAVEHMERAIQERKFGYVCVTNSRTAYLAQNNEEYCCVQNASLMTVPDGAPLVAIARNSGVRGMGRVTGKDLMDRIFAVSRENGYSHYFYGSTPETIENLQSGLKARFPGIDVRAAESPPFQEVDRFDVRSLAREVNRLRPTFFWCGLGAPKQELLMSRLQPHLEATISIGVGLAFEYCAGSVPRAPGWLQKGGCEALYNVIRNPVRGKRMVKASFWVSGKLLGSIIK